VYKFDNVARGIGELQFFHNPSFERVQELDNNIEGIGKPLI
jgi:hypothetical protein